MFFCGNIFLGWLTDFFQEAVVHTRQAANRGSDPAAPRLSTLTSGATAFRDVDS